MSSFCVETSQIFDVFFVEYRVVSRNGFADDPVTWSIIERDSLYYLLVTIESGIMIGKMRWHNGNKIGYGIFHN
jgi:hypothetical protein